MLVPIEKADHIQNVTAGVDILSLAALMVLSYYKLVHAKILTRQYLKKSQLYFI